VTAGGETVTVLRQEGSVDWDELPQGRRSEAGDTEVWVAIATGPATVIGVPCISDPETISTSFPAIRR
jgi:hypothetical protein